MSEIVVIGSLNMDLDVKTERAPKAGETVHGDEFQTIPGGKGANQAAAIARLGGSVAIVGRVGQDSFGDRLKKNLEDLGVDTGHVRSDTYSSTGVALITIEASGENRIIVVPGANGRVDNSDLQAAVSLLREAKLAVMQLELPLPIVEQAIQLAVQYHVPVLLNPAPAAVLEDNLLGKIQYLILNESEAQTMTGIEVIDDDSAKKAGQALLARGVNVVVITLGERGAVLVTKEQTQHVPTFQVKAVDTTAAGDAFIGGFAVSTVQGKPLPDCVRFGNASGALAATKFGAQTSLPFRREVERLLAG